MIRRKIWATATFCLAVAGAAQAQTGGAQKATLGDPGYIARGASPSYPQYVPRSYTAPVAPTYAVPTPNLPTATPLMAQPTPPPAPIMVGVPAAPESSVQFAADMVPMVPTAGPLPGVPTVPAPGTTTPMPMPMPMAVPMNAQPMPGTPMANPGAPAGTVTQGPIVMDGTPVINGMNGPLVAGPINGGPIVDEYGGAPFLDGYGAAMPGIWASAEYLNWRFRGANLPPLVSIAPAGAPGTLSDARTAVVYGGDDRQSDWQSGFRVRGGTWLEGGGGIDVGFFYVGRLKNRFRFGSNGDPGIFRPFFDTSTGAENAALVSFVDPVFGPVVAGRVTVRSVAELWGGEVNYRSGWSTGFGGRLDALVGVRYARLDEKFRVTSDLTTAVAAGAAPAGTAISVTDRFQALNQFVGGQVGLVGEWQIGNMTFGLRGTVAAGPNFQRREIGGNTLATLPSGAQVTGLGGVQALATNSGEYNRTVFSVLPEAGATIGYQVTNNLRVFGGYNVLSWNTVARAGEQINRNVNATFIPDPTTGTFTGSGAPTPPVPHRDSSFWVHGWTAGLEWRW